VLLRIHLVFFNFAYFRVGVHVRCTPPESRPCIARSVREAGRAEDGMVSVLDGFPVDFPVIRDLPKIEKFLSPSVSDTLIIIDTFAT